jgi:carbon-monoxide dehydrogenase large subunit
MSVDGTWRLTVSTPLAGDQTVNMKLQSNGKSLDGRITDDTGTFDGEILDGLVDGDQLSFKLKVPRPVPTTVKFLATVTGDSMEGRIKMRLFGSLKAKAVRV